jgi:capsular polysaccharide transport system ATP-binding protein
MIELHGVSKRVEVGGRKSYLLDGVTMNIPSNKRIAVAAGTYVDAISFVHLLAGQVLPTSGYVRRTASVSFPLGYAGGFEPELSVRENVMHVARLYGRDPDDVSRQVAGLAQLGGAFDGLLDALTREQKILLSQVVGTCLPFDTYCLNRDYRGKAQKFMTGWLSGLDGKGVIIPVPSLRPSEDFCELALVLRNGELLMFNRVEAATEAVKN